MELNMQTDSSHFLKCILIGIAGCRPPESGLQSSCRNRMINGNRMHLSSISSLKAKGKPSSSGSRESIDSKTKGSGKVVCAQFTARCLNEDGLKDLINPFGEVVKIIMFPALAFVELGSTDQAADIVRYYLSNPVMVKGGQVTFSVSSTFNFLQSSRVLSFSPVPPGKESSAWKRQLLAAAKRFGPVEHSLFLPTQAFVEMTNPLDAQKLVGHHTSKPLKIDEIHIKVAFSSEYNTLPTISDRKSSVRKSSVRKSSDRKSSDRSRKSEDRSKRKRSPSPRRRNLSPRRDSPTTSKRRRSRERYSDRHKERVKSNSGGKGSPRSPSKQISSRNSRSPRRPRSPSKQISGRNSRSPRSHTKERVSSEKKTPGSCKTDPKKNKVSPTSTRSQPPTKEKTPSLSSNVMAKSEEAVVTTDQSKKKTETQEDGATEACDMDSDIEGMAVYGEDGEENSDMGEEEEEEGQVGEKEGEVGEAEGVGGEEEEVVEVEKEEVEKEEVEEEEVEEEESEEEGEVGEKEVEEEEVEEVGEAEGVGERKK
ncbi:cilia- and flagella-associated protein 251-like isoform X3 [Oncorhynchus nerka]|uniref:cilia- and flagella-associated protein 251-like isoform X3 n=1 Tax=Oncorhynchus nerka TaxID=8023 RepID=UPI0031B812FF